jgi:hypothetical protein
MKIRIAAGFIAILSVVFVSASAQQAAMVACGAANVRFPVKTDPVQPAPEQPPGREGIGCPD